MEHPSAASSHRMAVTEGSHPGEVRRMVREASLGVARGRRISGRAALVATEMANNLVRHTREGGEVILRRLMHEAGGGQPAGLELISLDRGPGMRNVAECLRDGYSSGGTAGGGLGAIRRQCEIFEIISAPEAGTAILGQLWREKAGGERRPGAHFSAGGVSVPLAGEEQCGDSWAVDQAEGRCRVMVADGLGHGPFAADASRAAIRVFRENGARPIAEIMELAHEALKSTRGAAAALRGNPGGHRQGGIRGHRQYLGANPPCGGARRSPGLGQWHTRRRGAENSALLLPLGTGGAPLHAFGRGRHAVGSAEIPGPGGAAPGIDSGRHLPGWPAEERRLDLRRRPAGKGRGSVNPENEIVLFQTPIRQESDVLLCRTCAERATEALAVGDLEAIWLTSLVCEVAQAACAEMREVSARFTAVCPPNSSRLLYLRAAISGQVGDAGRLDASLRAIPFLGRPETENRFRYCRLESPAGEARLRMEVRCGEGPEAPDLEQLREMLSGLGTTGPAAALAEQNRDMLRVLDALDREQEQISHINAELLDTNRGVVALYDELDTLYRVSSVVAAQLDLQSLLQAITNATTEITGAEFGAFFYKEPEEEGFAAWTTAGLVKNLPAASLRVQGAQLFGPGQEVLRVSDTEQEPGFAAFTREDFPMRSYLALPVRDHAEGLAGGLVFGHRKPGAFTERTERIMAGVATQAAVGLENARLYQTVQKANAAKDHFLAMLSHELRTPLNPIMTVLTDLLEHAVLPERVRQDLQVVQRNVLLEARLIDDLLDITRIVKGKAVLHFELTDIHTLVANVCDICRADLEAAGLELRRDLQAANTMVYGDTARLQQVLWNLLKNAIKFTPPGGKITIGTRDLDGWVCVEVADTGRGIPPEVLPNIFKPFEQGDARTTAQFGGLGLGLTIAKRVMDVHAGQIHAESGGRGQGATLYIKLKTAAAGPHHAAPPGVDKPAADPKQRWDANILLVDDDPDTVFSLKRLLERRGFRVLTASDCAGALEVAREEKIDAVISDVGLPDGSGAELMSQLRDRHGLKGIALSGYGMESDIERSIASGFAAHFTKPLNFPAMLRALDELLGKGAGS